MGQIARLLHARTEGDGPRDVVLVHGFGTDSSVWSAYVPWLARYRRVVTFDLPCAGTVADAAFDLRRHQTYDGYVSDLLSLLRDLDVRRCTLVGHSMGAMVGLLAAVVRPENFEKLVLIGASACYRNEPGYEGGLGAGDLDGMLRAIETDFTTWAAQAATAFVARDPGDPATLSFSASLRRMRPDIALHAFRMILSGDLRDRVRACRVPTVLLQTKDDAAVPRAAADFLAAAIPGSVLEIMDARGHLPHLSSTEVVADALARHLAVPAGTA